MSSRLCCIRVWNSIRYSQNALTLNAVRIIELQPDNCDQIDLEPCLNSSERQVFRNIYIQWVPCASEQVNRSKGNGLDSARCSKGQLTAVAARYSTSSLLESIRPFVFFFLNK